VLSSHADLQVARGTVVTGEYAAKRDIELIDGRWIAGNAQLVSVRATRDLGERWDIGVAARVLANANFSTRTGGLGAELGYRVVENLWVSLGYNISGFRDRDLADDSTSAAGVFVRMRFKFDESLFGGKPECCPAKATP
jgi:nuclear transport factor 2 (NTF2) superfamily protein